MCTVLECSKRVNLKKVVSKVSRSKPYCLRKFSVDIISAGGYKGTVTKMMVEFKEGEFVVCPDEPTVLLMCSHCHFFCSFVDSHFSVWTVPHWLKAAFSRVYLRLAANSGI